MSMTPALARQAAHAVPSTSLFADPPKRSPNVQLRRYDIVGLDRTGSIVEKRHVAPALPLFEDAFCAFARGSVIETETGPMAIEDLLPGDRVLTIDGRYETLMWIGRTLTQPGQLMGNKDRLTLTRVTEDSFGMARPTQSLVIGPSARLLYTPHHLRGLAGAAQMLTPATEFVDGVSVIETTPPTPVELFHICLARHAVIRIGGLEFETFHPGPNAARKTSHQMRDLFLNLFPHVDYLSSFGALAFPRAGDGPVSAVGA